jgi:CheY-like chemotaxis protein
MPKLDGVAAAQKIRASGPMGAQVPILIATAESGFAAARLAERAGADRVLFKPLQAIDYAMALPGSEAAPQAGKDKPSASAA